MITPITIIESKLHTYIQKLRNSISEDLGRASYIEIAAQVVVLDELLQEMRSYYEEDDDEEVELIW